mmetsp:Transcript_69754/g.152210  ORF Transcript_69754/g.152210 Transcript_69754/m.152210 type:complete len:99 (+) Transcript_69754:32-328(+)
MHFSEVPRLVQLNFGTCSSFLTAVAARCRNRVYLHCLLGGPRPVLGASKPEITVEASSPTHWCLLSPPEASKFQVDSGISSWAKVSWSSSELLQELAT